MVASADTAPLCVDGTCKCDTEVDACTAGEKCIGKKCVAAACGDAPAACPENEVCDSDVCKCPDKNGINGTSCAGNPGGEYCDATADAPTCKCTDAVDSCSGNLLAPNCDAPPVGSLLRLRCFAQALGCTWSAGPARAP